MDIQECLKDHPDGLSLADISIKTDTDPDTVRIALKKFVIEGIVGERGKTRGHKYFLVQSPETSIVKSEIRSPTIEVIPEPKPLERLVDNLYDAIGADEIVKRTREKLMKEGIASDKIKEGCVEIIRRDGRIYKPYLVRELMDQFPDAEFADIAVSVRAFRLDIQNDKSFLKAKYPELIYEKDSCCFSIKKLLTEG